MIRSMYLQLTAVVCLFAMTACTSARKPLLGNPQSPYPPQSAPKIGDIVHLPTGTTVSMTQMLAVAGEARIVYVGETHDNPASHRLELQVLQGLEELHPGRQALGMEMFPRSQQKTLDRWIAGELDEKTFLKESHWFQNWHMDFDYYRDLLNFARDRKIPLIALNTEKSLVEAMRSKPVDQLSAEQQAQLPELDFSDTYHRAMVTAFFGGHSHGKLMLDGFVRVQTLWDETMAESAAHYLASPAGANKRLVVIAGGNHVSYGFGTPRRVFRRLPTSYVLIGGHEINVPAAKKDRYMNVESPDFPMVPYDFVAFLPYEDLPITGLRLGVAIEPSPTGRGLTVKSVQKGSNAERAGLRTGDILLGMDGENLSDNWDLTYAVKKKHPGDHGRLQVERQGQPVEMDVVFEKVGKDKPAP